MIRCIFATVILSITLIFPVASAEKPVASGEKKALVTHEACRVLTRYIPADDVAYQGGVDVTGKPVTPADLAPAPDLGLGDRISFSLILDVAKESRGNENSKQLFRDHPGLRGEISLGQVVIQGGKVTLDGKPLVRQDREQLIAFCRKIKKSH